MIMEVFFMKKTMTSGLWYDARGKEIGGFVLTGREVAARWYGLYPNDRAGLRIMGVRPVIQTTIL